MPRYAHDTKVSRNKSRDEVEGILLRCGAKNIFTNDINSQEVLFIAWSLHDKPYKFELPFPKSNDVRFTKSPTGKPRKKAVVEALYQQALRQYWRIARNYIYMLTEIMEACGMEFHEAFAPLLALKNGSNMWQTAAAQAEEIQSQNSLMALMPPEKIK